MQWAAEAILINADVSTLSNSGMYPFVISMSCLTGYFGYLDALLGPEPSLAEALLQAADKGAVAALMPTGMTTTTGQSILNNAVFEAFFVNDIRQLGPAIASAKQTLLANGDAYFEQISARPFCSLAIRRLTLKIPLPRMPTGVAAYRENNTVRISWNAAKDSNGNAVAGYNIYRANAPAGPYSKINTALVTATEFIDTAGSVGIDDAEGGTGSSYYAVSSVDSAGDESAQSLGISPASLASAAGGAAWGSGMLCRYGQAVRCPKQGLWLAGGAAGHRGGSVQVGSAFRVQRFIAHKH